MYSVRINVVDRSVFCHCPYMCFPSPFARVTFTSVLVSETFVHGHYELFMSIVGF